MSPTEPTPAAVQHVPAWFEIPVADYGRAKAFYEAAFGLKLNEEAMGDMTMAVFPHARDAISGCLLASPWAKPTAHGTVVYLHTPGDLQIVLNRAAQRGAEVLVPKTALPPSTGGFFAVMRDSEGNRVGLFSMQ